MNKVYGVIHFPNIREETRQQCILAGCATFERIQPPEIKLMMKIEPGRSGHQPNSTQQSTSTESSSRSYIYRSKDLGILK